VSVRVKICGVTSLDDAVLVREAGGDAVGLNFVPSSPRCIELDLACRIREELAGSVEIVAVVADLDEAELGQLLDRLEPDLLQLHGSESPQLLARFLPRAYKAVRVAEATDVERARDFGGDRILADAKVPGALGGTGHAFDYSLVQTLARTRKLILAGGLTPRTVARAVAQVRPFAVDVASGVEVPGAPGKKDPERVRAFIGVAKKA